MLHTALRSTGPSPSGTRAAWRRRSRPRRASEVLPVGARVVVEEGETWRCSASAPGRHRRGRGDARAQGLQPTLVDARLVKPLDTELLRRLAATHERIVTVEENTLAGGFGSAVAESLADSRVTVLRLGLPDAFVTHGSREPAALDVGLTPTRWPPPRSASRGRPAVR